MGKQNRVLVLLLGVLAVLVLVVGGLSAFLIIGGKNKPGSGSAANTTAGGGGGDAVKASSGVLRLAGTDPVTLDPHLASDSTSAEYVADVYSGLVTLSPKLELQLDLAKSVDVSSDGKTYTFVLRDNAFFHSGRKVTADDVKWSLERASSRDLKSQTAPAYLNDIVGFAERFGGKSDTLSGVQVVNPSTIKITIDSPKPYFLAKLSYPTSFVLDKDQVTKDPKNWTRKPNGTGPYKLTEWTLGERIVLDANDKFYNGVPKLKQAVYLLAGGSALTRFENNELDVSGISIQDIDRARDSSSALSKQYSVWPQFSISYLAFNVKVPPFDDVHVRRALGYAMDRKRITQVTFKSMLLPATGIMMPGLPGYQEGDKTLPFDLAKAKDELSQAKYGTGPGKTPMPPIQMTEVGGGAEARVDTQAYLDQWKGIGLNVEIRQADFATFLADQDAGKLQAFNAGWIMDYPDPEDILDLKFHTGSNLNNNNYSNPAVDKLLDQARTESDTAKRLDLYRQAEKLILADAPWLPLYFEANHQVVNPAVKGWFDPPMVVPRLRFIEVTR